MNRNQEKNLALNLLQGELQENPLMQEKEFLLPAMWDEVAKGNTFDPDYSNITFESNATTLLSRVLQDAIKNGEIASFNHYLSNLAGELNIDTQSGYGLTIGANQPNPMHPGDKFDWKVTGKIPLKY